MEHCEKVREMKQLLIAHNQSSGVLGTIGLGSKVAECIQYMLKSATINGRHAY